MKSFLLPSNPRVPFQLQTDRSRLLPPKGKPLICHIVVAFEHWPFDQAMPRSLFPKPLGISQGPDIANFCWLEYGLRTGMPRLLELLRSRDLPVSVAMNSSVIEVYPRLAEKIVNAGWQIMAHGITQRSLEREDNEVAVIRAALDKLEEFSGKRPRSWVGPGFGETLDTPDHLAAAGIEFLYDWCLDDLPARMTTTEGRLYAMPYALELNDVTMFAIEKHDSHIYLERYRDTIAVFEREIGEQPRVLTLALHPHIIAQPHRLPYLLQVLDILQARSDAIFMTCDEIGDWYRAEDQSLTIESSDTVTATKTRRG